MSDHVNQFLWEKGVAVSSITPKNTQSNGYREWHNSIIWKSIQLTAANHGSLTDPWECYENVAGYGI